MFHNKEAIRQILRVLAGEAACVALMLGDLRTDRQVFQAGAVGRADWRRAGDAEFSAPERYGLQGRGPGGDNR